ncbi:MAG: Spore cortex-lytic enzyme [Syntrophomonadaceae bacterium]|nr:Spore cortex-lytic enzyme [Bacillota bacterium]
MKRKAFLLKAVVMLLVGVLSTGGTAGAFNVNSAAFFRNGLRLVPARWQIAGPERRLPFLGASTLAFSIMGRLSPSNSNLASIVPLASSVSTTVSPVPAVRQAPVAGGTPGGQAAAAESSSQARTAPVPPSAAPQSAPPAQTGGFRFTPAELDLFARLVHAEAAGEPFEGQVAVAASVLNRIRSPLYPDTLSAVIYQVVNGYYQYSPVLDGRINLPANESARRAVQEALSGRDPSLGALGFFNPRKTDNQWVRSRPVTVTIGQHVFIR